MGSTDDMVEDIARDRSGQCEVQLRWNPFATDPYWYGIALGTLGVTLPSCREGHSKCQAFALRDA